MAIQINDIPPQGLTVQIEDKLDLAEKGTHDASFRATVTLRPEGNGIFHVSGTVDAETSLECSRCLRQFPFSVRGAVLEFDLLPERSQGSAAEHELGRGELDSEFYQGEEIEPREFIREQILLAVPMVPLHDEGCRGLCPVCGADRNETPCTCGGNEPPGKESPFAVLKTIIKPEKEQ